MAPTPKNEITANMPTEGSVVIGCKFPQGIIMRAFEMCEAQERVLGGGVQKFKRAQSMGDGIKVWGPATPIGQSPRSDIVNGFALTKNVPADFAKVWFDQNAGSDLVKNGLMFWAPDMDSARKEAKARAGVKSGLEQLDTGRKSERGVQVPADPRWPRRTGPAAPNVSDIETEGEVEVS